MFKRLKGKLMGTTKVNGIVKNVVYNVNDCNNTIIGTKIGSGYNATIYSDAIANKYVEYSREYPISSNWLDLANLVGYSDFSPEQYINTRQTTQGVFSMYKLTVKEPNNAFLKQEIEKLNAFCGRVIVKDVKGLQKILLKVLDDRMNYEVNSNEERDSAGLNAR